MVAKLLRTDAKHTCGSVSKYLADAIQLYKSIEKTIREKNPSSEKAAARLQNLLHSFYSTKEVSPDQHSTMVMRWWIPQGLEIMTLNDFNKGSFDLSVFAEVFERNSQLAIFLLIGEYFLVFSSLVTHLTQESYNNLSTNDLQFYELSQSLLNEVQSMQLSHTNALKLFMQYQQHLINKNSLGDRSIKELIRFGSELSLDFRQNNSLSYSEK